MPGLLDSELAVYADRRDQLLAASEDKFVLVHGRDVIGTYESEADAVAQGYERFGNVPFLVKKVVRVEVAQNFVSNLLG